MFVFGLYFEAKIRVFFESKVLSNQKEVLYLHPLRAISSVGSEHLVYTEGVGGSNPSSPTDKNKSLAEMQDFFHL